MNILSIKPALSRNSKKNSAFVESLLSKGIVNDYLFDRYFIEIKIDNSIYNDAIHHDNIVCYLYRRLWETNYIKAIIDGNSFYTFKTENNTETIILRISLSEAITFIKSATPPNPKLQRLIPDAIKSIPSIIDTLKQFLMDDNSGQRITYQSIFKHIIRFECFDTIASDILIPDTIKCHNKQGGLCYIQMANMQINDILLFDKNESMLTLLDAQMLFKLDSADKIHKFIYSLYEFNKDDNKESYIKILNVFKATTTQFFYVSLYCDNVPLSTFPNFFKYSIQNMYKPFLS